MTRGKRQGSNGLLPGIFLIIVGVLVGADHEFGIVALVLGPVLFLNGIVWLVRQSRQAQPAKPRSRTIPQDVKIAVAMRDQGSCRHCGSSTNLHYDHILPYSRGGRSDSASNIQLLCGRCNTSKGARYVG